MPRPTDFPQLPPVVVTALLGLVQAVVESGLPSALPPPLCANCAALLEAEAFLAEVQRPAPQGSRQKASDPEIAVEVDAVLTVLQLFHPVAASPWQIAQEVELPQGTVQVILRGLAVRGMIEHPRRGYYQSWQGPEEDTSRGQGGAH
jgi:hypothetical protein